MPMSVPTRVIRPHDTDAPNSGGQENVSSIRQVTIRLDELEVQLLGTLVAAANAAPRTSQLRVAGGWVRDKILGMDGYDVDIAIDGMTGVEFATLVQDYLKTIAAQDGIHPAAVSSTIGVIAANPAQSKHLETATMKVHGIQVDFCNLRTHEQYTQDSRIPITSFGTPKEDAERRDFTINALFYNLSTHQVEDWTGRGIQDLFHKTLVTPLDPILTLQDDPLRVLRALRFAIRFDCTLHPDLEMACRSTLIHKALNVKVSRERVGKELEGMLTGKGAKPFRALETIANMGLAPSVFRVPDEVQIIYPTTSLDHGSEWLESTRLLEILTLSVLPNFQETETIESKLNHRLLALATFLTPFRDCMYTDHKMKQHMVVECMMREGIKFNNKDCQSVCTIVNSVNAFTTLFKNIDSKIMVHDDWISCRLEAGLIMRSTKELWCTTLVVTTALLLLQQQSSGDNTTSYVALLQEFYTKLFSPLDRSWTIRPLLDGTAILKALELPRGPAVGNYLEEQVRWMLLNPSGTKEECLAHLRKRKEQSQPKKMKIETNISGS